MQAYLVLLGVLLLGYFSHNSTVTYSSAFLLVLKLVLPHDKLLYFGAHGLNWGVILLTAAMLVPLATGAIGYHEIVDVVRSPEGIAAIVTGIIVALLGKWGVEVMTRDPQMVVSILVGTILGVIFLKRVPVGPMIASGILYVFMKGFHALFH